MILTDVKSYILADSELSALAGAPGPNGNYPDPKDQTICDVANARMVANSKKVPVENAFLYLIKKGKWRGLKNAENDPANLSTDAAYSAVELMGSPSLQVDFLDPVSDYLLGVLVQANRRSKQSYFIGAVVC